MITINELSDVEIEEIISEKIRELNEQGYEVTFGTIGQRTTYCLLVKGDIEVVADTHIRGDLSRKRDSFGRYKSLIHAMHKKYLLYDPRG